METAVTLEQSGRYGEAVTLLSRALAAKTLTQTDSARALFDRGLAYDSLGNMRAAEADYSAALNLDASLAPALSNRADTYRRSGRLAEAKRDYWAALKLPASAHEYPYYGLGLIAEEEGDGAAAHAFFQQAVAANPNFSPAVKRLAAALAVKTESGLRPSQVEGPGLASVAPLPAVAPAAVAPAAAPVHGNGVQVQLGAFQSEDIARAAWTEISAASGVALRGSSPQVSPVDRAGKPRLWRLRTAVADRAQASALCSALTQRQLACVAVWR